MFRKWNDLVGGCAPDVTDANGNVISKEVATLSCIPAVFANLLSALLLFAGLTALIMFIVGSLKFMNSAGDPKKVAGAQNNFVFGIIGLAIVIFSFLFIQLLSAITGVKCITQFGFGCT